MVPRHADTVVLEPEALKVYPQARFRLTSAGTAHLGGRCGVEIPLTESQRHQPSRKRVPGKTGDLVNIELVHHLLPMLLNGLNADPKAARGMLVGAPFGHQLQYLRFTR